MRYQNVALTATGGGAFLAGALGLLLNSWIILILSVMLVLLVVGFIRLRKGEKKLKFP